MSSLERMSSMSVWPARRARMAAKSTGRGCSWIWTESRAERWVKMRWPQTSQPGRGEVAAISEWSRYALEGADLLLEALPAGFHRSNESRVRRIKCGWPVRNLSVSVTWMEAARLTAVERMPAVSQVSTLPEGGLGKMQARQAVGATGSG